jgi:large subunit ribosomal protein L5
MQKGSISLYMITHLKEKYNKEVLPEMKKEFGYKSSMAVPKIEKVSVNVGFGRSVVGKSAQERKKIQEGIIKDLSLITGQKMVLRKAKKSISSFKTRKGMSIGTSCMLRGKKMNDFLERLIHVALPRSRDFKGIDPKSVDQSGNLSIGIKEHIIFPEVSPEQAKQIFGLEVTIATTAENKEEGLKLFKLLGFPIKEEEKKK